MEKKHLGCPDCFINPCIHQCEGLPAYCPTPSVTLERKAEIMGHYEDEQNQKIMQAAASIEYEFYCKWTRLEETIEFAKRIGARKIGIATCVGLIRETRILTKILKSHGFEVIGLSCKVGAVPKTAVGIDEACNAVGCNMCNPIMQAELLNDAETDMNIVVGLCVGHDSLFYKYSKAVTTTLIAKDRVTGHNPAAPLYLAESYYGKKVFGEEE